MSHRWWADEGTKIVHCQIYGFRFSGCWNTRGCLSRKLCTDLICCNLQLVRRSVPWAHRLLCHMVKFTIDSFHHHHCDCEPCACALKARVQVKPCRIAPGHHLQASRASSWPAPLQQRHTIRHVSQAGRIMNPAGKGNLLGSDCSSPKGCPVEAPAYCANLKGMQN